MTQKEQAIAIAISEQQHIIDDQPLRLYSNGEYRFGRDYDTKDGRWEISEREDGIYIITRPDLGIIKVDLSVQRLP